MTVDPSLPRARRMRPEDRREQIVAAARALALEEGLDAISRRTLAARIGVAAALIGHYTTSMEDLVAETFTAISARELAEVRELATARPTPTAALAATLASLLGGERDDVTAVWTDGWSLGRRSAPLAGAVLEQLNAWERLMGDLLRDGVAAGEFRCASPEVLAREVMGMIDGLNAQALVRRRAGGDPGESEPRVDLVAAVLATELGIPREALGPQPA